MELRRLKLSAVVLLASLVMPGTAFADSENAASVVESSGCREVTDGVICYETRWVTQSTQSPYGVSTNTAIGDTSTTYTGADGCTWTRSMKKREHTTFRSGPQQGHVLQVTDYYNTCSGEVIDCTHYLHFAFGGGESRLHKVETECRPVESA